MKLSKTKIKNESELFQEFALGKSYVLESENGEIISVETEDNDIINYVKTKGLL